ncbi:MarR family transcriptional regulator [Spongiibacter sp. KMU-166]|uniref:MarR family transcriptional regulator n=1 Tax=Spongiibacter thalassae TaxID=2721624 RepID=A0ABX1GBU7_9GAMM|nr:MarR family transcriptional regulator [Spongiibacter thalassae]
MNKHCQPQAQQQINKQRLKIGFLIHDVSRLRRTIYDQYLKPLGITRSQWWVLVNLSRRNRGDYTQVELARQMDLGKVTLGGLIDRLEEAGFVSRVADARDRRSKRLLISPKGADVMQQIEAISAKLNGEILKNMTPEQEAQLAELLSAMKRNLLEMESPTASTRPEATSTFTSTKAE